MHLSENETNRYHRHLLLPQFGKDGQIKLKSSKVLLVGIGGLGSPTAIYLAAAGVGTIGIIDPDIVDYSNLQRQVIHFTSDVGRPKIDSAKEKILKINPEIQVKTYQEYLSKDNALKIIQEYDLIIDGTDNFSSRYLINDACVLSNKPFIYGGVFRFEGQCSVFNYNNGPCYRCFFQEPPDQNEMPSCAEAGVLGILPGIIGLLQSNEAIKLLSQIGEPLSGMLLLFDALATNFRKIKIKKDPNCPMCSMNATIHELHEYREDCQMNQPNDEINVSELNSILQKNPETYLIDVREQQEWDMGHIDNAILKPLSNFEDIWQDIPKDKPVYVYCKMGGRSRHAVEFLKTKEYKNVFNVTGGFDAWCTEID